MDQQEPNLSNEKSAFEYAPGKVVFEKFEILRFVAAGGMGRVYQARDIRLNNIVALKVLLSDGSSDRDFVRFQKEAKTASKLNHPNIATIYDFGLVGKTPYLSMEYVDGLSLKTILTREKIISLEIFMAIFLQVCAALAHAHRNGVVHRDIKPDNIVIQKNDRGIIAKILDFGIAKRVDGLVEQEAFTTATGDIVGSPLYMSPEQAKSVEVTPKSDIYSLGCVMWQCLSGTSPFRGETALDTIMNHQHMRLEDMNVSLPQTVPANLAALVTSMLSKEPVARPGLETDILPILQELHSGLVENQDEHYQEDVERDIARLFNYHPATAPGVLPPKPFRHTKVLVGFAAAAIALGSSAAFLHVLNSKPSAEETVVGRPIRTHDGFVIGIPLETFKGRSPKQDTEVGPLRKFELIRIGEGANDFDLASQKNLERVKVLDLSDSLVTENGIANLEGRVPHLLKLNLAATEIVGLKCVAKLETLRYLVLDSTRITDRSLSELFGLEQLRELRLGFTKVTDNGLNRMPPFPRLTLLDLSGIAVSGDTLRRLAEKYKTLEQLRLRQTPVTVAAVRRLMKEKPSLVFVELKNCSNINAKELAELSEEYPCTLFSPSPCALSTATDTATKLESASKFESAKNEFQRCIDYIVKQHGNDSGRLCKYLIAVGRNYKSLDIRSPEALRCFERAIVIAKKHNQPFDETMALDGISNTIARTEGIDAAIPYFERGDEAARRTWYDKQPEALDKRLNTYADFYVDHKRFAKASALYLESAELRKKKLPNMPRSVAVSLTKAGNCYLKQMKYSEAGNCFGEALEVFEQSKFQNNDNQKHYYALALAGRAEVEFRQGNREKALGLNTDAYNYSRQVEARKAAAIILASREKLLIAMKRPQGEINAVRKEIAATNATLNDDRRSGD